MLPPAPAPPPMHEARHEIVEASARGCAYWRSIRTHWLHRTTLATSSSLARTALCSADGRRPQSNITCSRRFTTTPTSASTMPASRVCRAESRAIAGATVSAWSARIGDGRSTYRDGYVTAVNARAAQCGGEIGISTIDLVARLVAARLKEYNP